MAEWRWATDFFDKLGVIEEFFEEEGLVSSSWQDEKDRSAFSEDMEKLFTGRRSDFVCRSVQELMK